MSERHTLTVVHDPDSDDYTTTINHPKDRSNCPSTWWECMPCPDPPPDDTDPYEWYEQGQLRHGVEHIDIGNMWCVESPNECYFTSAMNRVGLDDVPVENGTYMLDYEGGDIDESWLLIGERIEVDG